MVNEHIQEGTGAANIIVEVDNTPVSYPKGTFVEANGCIAMEAQHYTAKRDVPGGGFALLKPYGRLGTALKVFPATANFENSEERPIWNIRLLRQKTETIMYSSICPPPRRSPLSQSSISVIRSMAERCRL